ncbi:MAG: RNA polymerase sigma factor [Ktedonobacteraceae bacterium]|nr:RNA polymerase sigma factor [Chloroflexota bacterium]
MLAFAIREPEAVAISSVPAAPIPQNTSVEADVKPEVHEQYMLVSRALQGDQEAFAGIVALYSATMLRTAYLIVEDRDVAEDVVQDAFIQAWHHLPDLREAGALRPWLMRIVVNQCISFKRRVARSSAFVRQALSEQETDMLAQVADHFKGRMERNWDLAHAIENLPVRQRVAIVLHYYNGMTLPEMARALHISENTLKKRIQAALANLRQVLRSEGGESALPRHTLPHFATSVALSPAG